MQDAHQARTHGRHERRGVECILETPSRTRELPTWESFPLEDRHRLVRVILQAARHQVETRSTGSLPRM
jgi:hypothetical protein